MRSTRIITFALLLSLTATFALPQSAVAKKGAKEVAKDNEGDWGDGQAPAEMGDFLGQDLVGADIWMKDKKTLVFAIRVTSLPPWGGWPEVTRYTWGITVGKEYYELDGKWMNYSRGACDPTSGQCPPPRDPGMQPFLVRTNCRVEPLVATNFTVCDETGVVQATFNVEESMIEIPVTLKMLKAKPGTKITAGMSDFLTTSGGSITAYPSAWVSTTGFPHDAMAMTGTFVVPK
jgi:hypothetical protein